MYSANWFDKNKDAWLVMLKQFVGKPDLNFLEVGCFEGKATKWLIDNILTGTNPAMTVVDDFIGGKEYTPDQSINIEGKFRENLKGYEPLLNIYKGKSGDILRGADFQEGTKFDFIYIDASHYAPNVIEDTILCWGILKPGGIMVWDDYGWGRHIDPKLNPKMAIDAFLAIYEGQYTLLFKGYQVAVIKL